jgi:hypothetical protein
MVAGNARSVGRGGSPPRKATAAAPSPHAKKGPRNRHAGGGGVKASPTSAVGGATPRKARNAPRGRHRAAGSSSPVPDQQTEPSDATVTPRKLLVATCSEIAPNITAATKRTPRRRLRGSNAAPSTSPHATGGGGGGGSGGDGLAEHTFTPGRMEVVKIQFATARPNTAPERAAAAAVAAAFPTATTTTTTARREANAHASGRAATEGDVNSTLTAQACASAWMIRGEDTVDAGYMRHPGVPGGENTVDADGKAAAHSPSKATDIPASTETHRAGSTSKTRGRDRSRPKNQRAKKSSAAPEPASHECVQTTATSQQSRVLAQQEPLDAHATGEKDEDGGSVPWHEPGRTQQQRRSGERRRRRRRRRQETAPTSSKDVSQVMVTTAKDGDRLSTRYTRGGNQASLPQPHLNDVIPAIDPDAHAGCTDGGAAAATALTKVHQKRVHVASKGTVVGLSRRVKEAEAVAEAEKDRLRSERKAQSEIAQLAMTQAAAAPQAEKDTPGVSPGREIANTAGQSSAAEEGRQPTDMQALAAGPSQRHSTGDPHVAGSIETASQRTISSAVVVSSHAPSAATAADATTANGSVAELRTAAAEEPWLPGLSDGRSGAYAIVVPARVPAAASTSPPSAGAPPPPPVKPSEAAGSPHAAARRDEEFEHDQPLGPAHNSFLCCSAVHLLLTDCT